MSEEADDRLSVLDPVLDAALASRSTRSGVLGAIVNAVTGTPGADLAALAGDLFAVADALEANPALRRALTDPSTPEDGRRQLAHGVLDGRVGELAVEIVAESAALRWAGGRTLAAALDRQGVRAELLRADEGGELEETEDELFRFARTVESNPELRNALADRSIDRAGRQQLVAQLLAGKATDSTVRLAQRAVAARERTFAHTIEGYVTQAAAQKNRVVATVRVAKPLTPEQSERLKAGLTRQIGRDVAIQEIVDEHVLGGVRVELGHEVIEGTVAGRLEDARRLFT
ncbi:MAG TPA: F0F1 ATP synthase subunit delta [Microlunatus sp.]